MGQMTTDNLPYFDKFWASHVVCLFDEPEAREAFRRDTGMTLIAAAKTPLAAVIDRACGVADANLDAIKHFQAWATLRHWGFEFAPAKYRADLLKWRAAGEFPWATDDDFAVTPDAEGGGE